MPWDRKRLLGYVETIQLILGVTDKGLFGDNIYQYQRNSPFIIFLYIYYAFYRSFSLKNDVVFFKIKHKILQN